MLVKCKMCSNILKTKPSRLKIGWGRYCSWKCRSKDSEYLNKISKANSLAYKEGRKKIPKNFSFKGYHHTEEAKKRMREKLSGEGNASWKNGKPKCVKCGRVLSGYKGLMCGKCRNKERIGKSVYVHKRKNHPFYKVFGDKHPAWKGGKPKCVDCGKELYWQRRKNPNCRCRKCFFKQYRGEKHHKYINGINRDGYPISFNFELKELIRKRDNYKCQLCGCPQEECLTRLPIHHIDYNKNNLDPKNLTALCKKCNTKVNVKRETWTKYFVEKINV